MKKKYFIIIMIFCLVMLVNVTAVRAEEVTDREIAVASCMAYDTLVEGSKVWENYPNGADIMNYGSKYELGDWTVVDYSNNLITEWSLKAITLQKGENIIIAYKGTDTEIITDALCGITNFHVQEVFANAYVDRIMNKYSKMEGNYKIYVTGHSLGGYIAQTTGARIAQRESKYDNVKLAKIVDFNSMGMNFIQVLGILRLRVINTLKKLSAEGRLVEYNIMGDLVSAGGVHYGEIRTMLPSIDNIVDYREKFVVVDSAQKIVRITNILTKVLQEDVLNIFKGGIDKARQIYQVDSLWAFMNLTHNSLGEFTSIGFNDEEVYVNLTDSSNKIIEDELVVNGKATIRAKTYKASAKTYKWYVSEDGVNWGEPVEISSLYEGATVYIPTNTFEIDLSDLKVGETRYYKVESYYDDKCTVGRCKQTILGYNYFEDEEQSEEYNSGSKEKIIKVIKGDGAPSIKDKISASKVTTTLNNIGKKGIVSKILNVIKRFSK